jgi:hypothetical protein
MQLGGCRGLSGWLAGEVVGLGPGLDELAAEGEAVDDAAQSRESVKVFPYPLTDSSVVDLAASAVLVAAAARRPGSSRSQASRDGDGRVSGGNWARRRLPAK